MLYKIGDKFDVQETDLLVEIVGQCPGSQRLVINNQGDHYYAVILNGFKTYLSEPVLKSLLAVLQSKETKVQVFVDDKPKPVEIKKKEVVVAKKKPVSKKKGSKK